MFWRPGGVNGWNWYYRALARHALGDAAARDDLRRANAWADRQTGERGRNQPVPSPYRPCQRDRHSTSTRYPLGKRCHHRTRHGPMTGSRPHGL